MVSKKPSHIMQKLQATPVSTMSVNYSAPYKYNNKITYEDSGNQIAPSCATFTVKY